MAPELDWTRCKKGLAELPSGARQTAFSAVYLGAGVALDAATRGLKTVLVEAQDFSCGTSSRSTKLIHGGVRYLELAFKRLDYEQFALVREVHCLQPPLLQPPLMRELTGRVGRAPPNTSDRRDPRGSIRRGARAVHARCGYWGCSVDPFIQSQSGGMVTPQSPPGTIYNSSPSRPSPREVVQIPDAVRTRCARGADTPPKGLSRFGNPMSCSDV